MLPSNPNYLIGIGTGAERDRNEGGTEASAI